MVKQDEAARSPFPPASSPLLVMAQSPPTIHLSRKLRETRFEVRGSRFEVRGARFEVRGSRREVRGSRCEVRGARFEVRGARFEGRGSRFEVRGSRCEVRGARFEVRGAKNKARERGTRQSWPAAGDGRAPFRLLKFHATSATKWSAGVPAQCHLLFPRRERAAKRRLKVARPFKAGYRRTGQAVAKRRLRFEPQSSLRDSTVLRLPFPALKGRAKLGCRFATP